MAPLPRTRRLLFVVRVYFVARLLYAFSHYFRPLSLSLSMSQSAPVARRYAAQIE